MESVKNKDAIVALISPGANAHAETFIRAHKNLLPFKILFFYDGFMPACLEGSGRVTPVSLRNLWIQKIAKKLSPTNNMLSDKEYFLLRAFKRNKVQIVLAEYGPTGAAVCRVCRLLNVPLLTFFHGYDASIKSILKKNKEKYQLLFNYAATIFSVSNLMTESLIIEGCCRSKITLNPCSPDDDFLEVLPSYTKQKFVAVGRFVDKKAPYYTILAFSKTVKKFPEAQLYMGGEGVLWNTCKNLVEYLNLQKNIEMPGVIDKQTFISNLKDAIGFVQHSVEALNGDSEGTPVAILEACAAGIPVIATKHAGITDIIQHNINGLLVNEHDIDAMADEMLYLLENKKEVVRLGSNARKNIVANYKMDRHINLIVDKINEVLFTYSKL